MHVIVLHKMVQNLCYIPVEGWGKNLSMFELGMCPWPLRTLHHYNLFGGQLEAHFVFTFE